jgi:hypothetical protein
LSSIAARTKACVHAVTVTAPKRNGNAARPGAEELDRDHAQQARSAHRRSPTWPHRPGISDPASPEHKSPRILRNLREFGVAHHRQRSRPRKVDVVDRGDRAGRSVSDEHAIGQEDRLGDAVRDQHHGLPMRAQMR